MTTFDDAVTRIQEAVNATDATVQEVHWQNTISSGDNTRIVAADCPSYAALCDHLGVKQDEGRWSARGDFRIYDAITRDNKVLIEHRCWPHLDCWRAA